MDEALLPGVGNILASESLFRARIDPRRPSRSLSRAEVRRLAGAILAAVPRDHRLRKEGPELAYVEEPARGWRTRSSSTRARARGALAAAGREIVRLVQAQRSTFYVPRCQR